MKKAKCPKCNGTGEIEVLESADEKFYREVAKPILDKAYNLPQRFWYRYNAERRRK